MNKFLKRTTALLLCVLLIFGMTACGSNDSDTAEDQNTLTFTMGPQLWGPSLVSALKEKFPDINFDINYYCGCNTSEYLKTQLEHDDAGDIFFGTTLLTEKRYTDNLLNLSGYSFTGNFEDSMLNQCDIDGAIYQLPCMASIRSMAYNKTMFKEKGWKVPRNHKELVALCKQIRKESDATPIAFAGKNYGFYFTTLTTMAQTGFLSTPAGKAWEKSYFEGNASCKEGFESGIAMLQKLIDADAYDVDIDENIIDSGPLMERLSDRSAAMTALWAGQSDFIKMDQETSDEFGLFPFYSESGDALLGVTASCNVGLSKDLEKKENAKKLENALRVMEWLSTKEGMSYFNTGSGTDLLTLKDVNNSDTAPLYRNLWDENLSSTKAPMLYSGYEDIMNSVAAEIKQAMKTHSKLDGVIELADRIHKEALSDSSQFIGSAKEDMSHPETVQLVANAMQAGNLADITLLSDGTEKNGVVNNRGCHGKIYSGDFTQLNFNTPLTLNFNAPLITQKLTGKEIADLLENGLTVQSDDQEKSAVFDYYWSGMDVQMEDGKVKKMTLQDGKEILPDRTYTVLFCARDYAEAKTPKDKGIPMEKTPEQLYLSYLKDNSPLKAPKVLRK